MLMKIEVAKKMDKDISILNVGDNIGGKDKQHIEKQFSRRETVDEMEKLF